MLVQSAAACGNGDVGAERASQWQRRCCSRAKLTVAPAMLLRIKATLSLCSLGSIVATAMLAQGTVRLGTGNTGAGDDGPRQRRWWCRAWFIVAPAMLMQNMAHRDTAEHVRPRGVVAEVGVRLRIRAEAGAHLVPPMVSSSGRRGRAEASGRLRFAVADMLRR